jgi:hypothetical protein
MNTCFGETASFLSGPGQPQALQVTPKIARDRIISNSPERFKEIMDGYPLKKNHEKVILSISKLIMSNPETKVEYREEIANASKGYIDELIRDKSAGYVSEGLFLYLKAMIEVANNRYPSAVDFLEKAQKQYTIQLLEKKLPSFTRDEYLSEMYSAQYDEYAVKKILSRTFNTVSSLKDNDFTVVCSYGYSFRSYMGYVLVFNRKDEFLRIIAHEEFTKRMIDKVRCDAYFDWFESYSYWLDANFLKLIKKRRAETREKLPEFVEVW